MDEKSIKKALNDAEKKVQDLEDEIVLGRLKNNSDEYGYTSEESIKGHELMQEISLVKTLKYLLENPQEWGQWNTDQFPDFKSMSREELIAKNKKVSEKHYFHRPNGNYARSLPITQTEADEKQEKFKNFDADTMIAKQIIGSALRNLERNE